MTCPRRNLCDWTALRETNRRRGKRTDRQTETRVGLPSGQRWIQGENRRQRMKGGRPVTWSDDGWSRNYHDRCPWDEFPITTQRNYAIILTPSAVHYCRQSKSTGVASCLDQTAQIYFPSSLDMSAGEADKWEKRTVSRKNDAWLSRSPSNIMTIRHTSYTVKSGAGALFCKIILPTRPMQ